MTAIADGVRDAVILEVSRKELNAFQVPNELLEPALSGRRPSASKRAPPKFSGWPRPVTTIAINARMTRAAIHGAVAANGSDPGDCPLVLGGGYTGFEHFLYRSNRRARCRTPAHFKWSRFNGGLVGRGEL